MWKNNLHRVVLSDGRKLIAASFRGVPFFVASASREGGRRVVKHEFPYRDDPQVEDLGRVSRTFAVEGYVVGDDYVAQRDALISAIEDTSGPGDLIHPYYGRRRAIASGLRVSESIQDGGLASFSITFDDAPDTQTIPVDAVDYVERVNNSAAAARTANADEFAALYDAASLPGFALQSAADTLTGLSDSLGFYATPITLTTQEAAKLTQQVGLLKAQATTLVSSPSDLLNDWTAAVDTMLNTTAGSPLDLLRACLDILATPPVQAVIETTPTREREARNKATLEAALNGVVLIGVTKLAAAIPYETIDQAVEVRGLVTDEIDRQLETAGDLTYEALLDLRSDFSTAIPSAEVIAREVRIERRVPIPSIVLAFKLYGDTAEELDVAARNRPTHPAFLVGTLKVLSSG